MSTSLQVCIGQSFNAFLFFFLLELDSEYRQDIFTQDDYHYLNVPVVGSFTVDNTFDCTLKCLRNPCCYSVNLAAYRGANGKIWCELLSSEKYSNSEKYKRNQTSHHLSTILEVKHYRYRYQYHYHLLSFIIIIVIVISIIIIVIAVVIVIVIIICCYCFYCCCGSNHNGTPCVRKFG